MILEDERKEDNDSLPIIVRSADGKQNIIENYIITKTYVVEVIDPDEAQVGSATIVPTDLVTSYPGSETTFVKSNMTFGYNTVANMSSAGIIQFKKQVGYVRNTVSINGLRSVEVIVASGKAFTGTLYSGTSIDSLTHSQAVEESGTYFIESGLNTVFSFLFISEAISFILYPS